LVTVPVVANGSIETASFCCFAWVGKFVQTVNAITVAIEMPSSRVRI
jgi:hypothetical protein